MAEEIAGYGKATAQMILAEINKLIASGYIPRGGTNRPLHTPQSTPIFIRNVSGEVIPRFACVQAVGTVEISGQNYIDVNKPVDVNGLAGPYLFNLFEDIEAGGTGTEGQGIASDGPVVRALGAGGAVAGAKYAPQVGSWEVAASDVGQFVGIGDDDIATNVGRVNIAGKLTCADLFTLLAQSDCDFCKWYCENCDPFSGEDVLCDAPCCGDCKYTADDAITNLATQSNTGGWNTTAIQVGPSTRRVDNPCVFDVPMRLGVNGDGDAFTITCYQLGEFWAASASGDLNNPDYQSNANNGCTQTVIATDIENTFNRIVFDVAGENCLPPLCCDPCEFTDTTEIQAFTCVSRNGYTYTQEIPSTWNEDCTFNVQTDRSDQPGAFYIWTVEKLAGAGWKATIDAGTESFTGSDVCDSPVFTDDNVGGSLTMSVINANTPCGGAVLSSPMMFGGSGAGDTLRQQSPELFTGCNGCGRGDVVQLMNAYGSDSLKSEHLTRFVDMFAKASQVTASREEIEAAIRQAVQSWEATR